MEYFSVETMTDMFNGAIAFNNNGMPSYLGCFKCKLCMKCLMTLEYLIYILSGWNVSSVKDMSGMFIDAIAFNQPLNSWTVSNVTNLKTHLIMLIVLINL